MGLFHLIEQHHAVGVAAHGLGQLAALVVAHVSRRRSDQALHGELLHVLGHVDAHHGLLGIEQVLGQRLGQLGLAHAGGAEEQERANGTVRVGKSRTVAADGTGHHTHSLVLADDAALQHFLQVDELFHLALHHLGHRDARPGGHNGGDLLFGNLFLQDGAVLLLHLHGFLGHVQLLLQLRNARVANLGGELQVALAGGALLIELSAFELGLEVLHANDGVLLVLPLGLLGIERFLGGRDVVAQLLQALLGGHVGLLHEGLLLDLHLDELALGGVHLFRHGVDLDAQAAGRFVHEVDGLVGQEAIGDVAVGQLRRAHDGAVGDAHAVAHLIADHDFPLLYAQSGYIGVGQGDGFVSLAQKAGDAPDVTDDVPGLVVHDHLHQHVAGEHLALHVLGAVVGNFGDRLHGDADFMNQIPHVPVFHILLDGGLHRILIAGIGVHHIPIRVVSHVRHP